MAASLATSYWLENLFGDLPETALHRDYPRVRDEVAYSSISFAFDASVLHAYSTLQRTADCSAFSILTTALLIQLSKYLRGDEFLIGAPSRTELRHEHAPPSMLPLRCECHRDTTCRTLLASTDRLVEAAFDHQDFAIDELLSALGISDAQGRSPLFDVALALDGYTDPIDLEAYPVDLAFAFEPRGWGTGCQLHYRTDFCDETRARDIAAHFVAALRELVSTDNPAVKDVQILSPSEIDRLVKQLNDNVVDFPLDQTLHGLFERQAARTPSDPAVNFKRTTWTYRELNERANRLAHALTQAGVGVGDFVAIMQHRNCNFLCAMLAVFKAGGAYVPVDPTYPAERVTYMLVDSQVKCLITEADALREFGGLPPEAAAVRLVISQHGHLARDDLGADCEVLNPTDLDTLPAVNLELGLTGEDRAYMIYTSGSTGRPKGAICRHNGALNHLFGELHGVGIDSAFSFLQTAASSSDISVWQFVAPLLYGGTTVIVDHDTVTDPRELFETIRDSQIRLAELVPVVLRALTDHIAALAPAKRDLPSLRCMMVTGDALPVDLVDTWLALYPRIPIANTYGPTEASDDVTLYVMREPLSPASTVVPIGQPMPNIHIYVLDPSLRLAPFGVPGEICVSGVCVGEGYWNQPEKTAAVFVSNPVPDGVGDVIYRTGDLGRWLSDGSIEFLGRLDQQVKIRGFRIEPGEVESNLLKHEHVGEAVVMARPDRNGNQRLVAYVVLKPGARTDTLELRDFLAQRIAAYMVPAVFILLDAMPLTPIGKINRKALPNPDEAQTQRSVSYVAPRTATERVFAEIWTDLLSHTDVGIHDDFLELGGDSILSICVSIAANQAGYAIRPKHVFQYPTIAELASAAEKLTTSAISENDATRSLSAQPFACSDLSETEIAALRSQFPGIVDAYPLAPTQLGIYLLGMFSRKNSGVYVEQIWLTLEGGLDLDLFEQAWQFVVDQTPVLRTGFARRGLRKPHQFVLKDANVTLRRLDWRDPSNAVDTAFQTLADEERMKGFDLTCPPLLRVSAVELSETTCRVLWTYHHVILDGWSEPLVLGNVLRTYAALRNGREPTPALTPSYRELIAWLAQQDWSEAEHYWRQQLAGFTEPARIAPPSTGPVTTGISHRWIERTLDEADRTRLEQTARRWKLTLSTLLQGAWALVLCRHSHSRDILFGSAVSGRQADIPDIESIIGLFITTLPVRVIVSDRISVRSWLKQLQIQTIDMRQFEHFGPARLQNLFEIPKQKLPAYESIFVMANYPGADLDTSCGGTDLHISGVNYITMPHYPLTLFIVHGQHLTIRLIYSLSDYGESLAATVLDDFVTMLGYICENPELSLRELI